jgi:hypothetical protein
MRQQGEAQEHAVESSALQFVGNKSCEKTSLVALVVDGTINRTIDRSGCVGVSHFCR